LLPWDTRFEDCVCDCHKPARDGDDDESVRLAAHLEALRDRFQNWCRVALKSAHPQFVCHGLTELFRLKGSGRGIEEALGTHQQRAGG